MAKIKLGAIVAEIRNSINGWVFARNKGGAYIRIKVTPTNPQTAAQVAARARLAQFAQAWRSLSEDQRAAWQAATSNFEQTDVFGDVISLSGNALYVKLNCNITNAGGSSISVPPTPLGATALGELSVAIDSGDDEIVLSTSPSTVPAGHAMVVEATAQVSAGVSNANSKFRQVQVIAAAGSTSANIFGSYTTKFGALVNGQKLFVRAKLVRLATGEVSQAQVANAIVA